MDAKQKCRVKYALALYRHEMGFRGPVGHGSGFDWIDGQDKAEIEEIVADRVARDTRVSGAGGGWGGAGVAAAEPASGLIEAVGRGEAIECVVAHAGEVVGGARFEQVLPERGAAFGGDEDLVAAHGLLDDLA